MKYIFETYENSEEIKNDILNTLIKILQEKQCLSIKMPIFTCINELLVNAIKANFKNLYFEKYAPQNNALEIIPYHKALQLFKLEMSTNRVDHLLSLAKENNVKAVVEINVSHYDLLSIVVSNPSEMTNVEIDNINLKRSLADKYVSLSDYFNFSESDPNKEGGGLGIIFITMMLKSFGLEKQCFQIYSKDNFTIAKIEIPLNQKIVKTYHDNTDI